MHSSEVLSYYARLFDINMAALATPDPPRPLPSPAYLRIVDEAWENYTPVSRPRSEETLPSFGSSSFQYMLPVVDVTWDDVWTIQDGKASVVDPARPSPVYSHSAVRPARGEGLVVDTGAVEDLTGNDFVLRHSADARRRGYSETWITLAKPRRLAGVGDATKTCTHAVTLTCALQSGEKVAYQAPVIPGGPGGSPVPPLLGLKSMQKDFVFFDLSLIHI